MGECTTAAPAAPQRARGSPSCSQSTSGPAPREAQPVVPTGARPRRQVERSAARRARRSGPSRERPARARRGRRWRPTGRRQPTARAPRAIRPEPPRRRSVAAPTDGRPRRRTASAAARNLRHPDRPRAARRAAAHDHLVGGRRAAPRRVMYVNAHVRQPVARDARAARGARAPPTSSTATATACAWPPARSTSRDPPPHDRRRLDLGPRRAVRGRRASRSTCWARSPGRRRGRRAPAPLVPAARRRRRPPRLLRASTRRTTSA